MQQPIGVKYNHYAAYFFLFGSKSIIRVASVNPVSGQFQFAVIRGEPDMNEAASVVQRAIDTGIMFEPVYPVDLVEEEVEPDNEQEQSEFETQIHQLMSSPKTTPKKPRLKKPIAKTKIKKTSKSVFRGL